MITKKEYEIWLADVKLPILPEDLKEIVQMDNDKYDIVGLGERTKPGKEKLHTWTISSYFPADGEIKPQEYREHYTSLVHREYNSNKVPEPIKPVEFTIIRHNEDDTSMIETLADVLFESIEWEDRKGEPGDIYYTFKLIEYKPFDKKKV